MAARPHPVSHLLDPHLPVEQTWGSVNKPRPNTVSTPHSHPKLITDVLPLFVFSSSFLSQLRFLLSHSQSLPLRVPSEVRIAVLFCTVHPAFSQTMCLFTLAAWLFLGLSDCRAVFTSNSGLFFPLCVGC